MKKTFSGAERGVGASYAWEGNSKAGAGSMTIAEATPQKISIALHSPSPCDRKTPPCSPSSPTAAARA